MARITMSTVRCLVVLYCFVTFAKGGSWFSQFSTNEKAETTTELKESDLVSPILNREIETSVVAHDWPTSPQNIFCEAYAYFFPLQSTDDENNKSDDRNTNTDNNPARKFLDNLVNTLLDKNPSPIETYSQAIDLVLEASNLDKFQRNLLKYALVLRARSPFCEVHRGLAHDSLLQMYQNKIQQMLIDNDTAALVATVYPQGTVHIIPEDSNEATLSSILSKSTSDSAGVSSDLIKSILLPGEEAQVDLQSTRTFLVLYGNLGTISFAQAYRFLQGKESDVQFIVRHRGDVYYEEKQTLTGGSPSNNAVTLQGYGVRLDIRNVEYKVFDDRSDGKSDNSENGLVNLTTIYSDTSVVDGTLSTPENQFIGGVNISAIRSSVAGTDLKNLEKSLWKIHDTHQVQSQIIPPVWQRRRLPLQAAAAIATSKDPLIALQEISQNLPSVASTLVHLKIPTDIHATASTIDELDTSKFRTGMLYINGKAFDFDRPSFNMFELLNLIQQEQQHLEVISKSLGPHLIKVDGDVSFAALKDVHKAWMMGSNFVAKSDNKETQISDSDQYDEESGKKEAPYRIDVGRGWKKAIMYVNDIEKDIQYKRWGRSLQQALMNLQFGMAPTVRRNLFTLLGVVDPIRSATNLGLAFGSQLMQSQYPARVGILVVSDDDIDSCKQWVNENGGKEGACPVDPILNDGESSKDDLRKLKASSQAVHRLVSRSMKDLASRAGAFPSYVDNLLTQIAEYDGEVLTLYDLVQMHGSLMEAMRVASEKESVNQALRYLTENDVGSNDDDESSTYGMTLRFAVDKGIKSGMSFLNGRPLPAADDSAADLNRVFGEETNYLFQLIVNGDITDTYPKSVYAKVLSGDRVFKRNHPLLSQDGSLKDSYVHGLGGASQYSLISSNSVPTFGEANFVVDAYLALDTKEGIDSALNIISSLDSFPSSLVDIGKGRTSIGLAYRILPSTPAAAASPICLVLSLAAAFGKDISSLKSVLSEYGKVLANQNEISNNEELLAFVLKSIPDDVREEIMKSKDDSLCQNVEFPSFDQKNIILANGRVFQIEGSSIEKDDFDLLFTMEIRRARAVTSLLTEHFSFTRPSDLEKVAATVSFLAVAESSSSAGRVNPGETLEILSDRTVNAKNPLYFTWNTESESSSELQLEAVIFLNPVTEVAQRVSPILRVLRDQLELPLHLVLAPPLEIDGDTKIPITSYYRLVADPSAIPDIARPKAKFSYLPSNHVLTIRVDVPEPWNIQQTATVQDTDNLLCDLRQGCSDESKSQDYETDNAAIYKKSQITRVEYGLKNLLIFGQCYETKGTSPNGLQLTISKKTALNFSPSHSDDAEVNADGTVSVNTDVVDSREQYSDTLVMKTVGYWQVRANPGIWTLNIAEKSKASEIFELTDGTVRGGRIIENRQSSAGSAAKTLYMMDFVSHSELLLVKRRSGFETASLFHDEGDIVSADGSSEVINVFSLATGHLYERFLKIMMLSVTKRTSSKVKFWLFENYLSPGFKSSTKAMAERIGCEVEYVTYKWPEWLRGQTEKQRIIWGYKILFLDVLFPLDVKKIIYVDADQVIRGDLKELWDMDLEGAPYGYTPFCTSRQSTLGYQFWRDGFWKNHLRGKPYHISALYVVDLERFRRTLVGDQLRAIYQQLSADPNSLSNLDQDLPNYAQHQVPIFSLPQEWLWCESWCSDETKSLAKTIDLCNNPEHKEPKVSMAKRIISGKLFNESWIELDAEVEQYEREFLESLS